MPTAKVTLLSLLSLIYYLGSTDSCFAHCSHRTQPLPLKIHHRIPVAALRKVDSTRQTGCEIAVEMVGCKRVQSNVEWNVEREVF